MRYGIGHMSYNYGMPFDNVLGLLPLFSVLFLIAIALKAYCLWHAARRDEKWWFIALVLINSLGLVELIYILFVLKKVPFAKKEIHHFPKE